MKTALYRHFDAAGRLLYVGISLSPTYRLSNHSRESHWSAAIASVTIEWLDTRQAALEAEARAIATERPAHNIQGRAAAAGEPAVAQSRPRVPVYVYYAEQVAAHFAISARAVDRAIQRGMPRERIGKRRFRYDLVALDEWARTNSETFGLEDERKKRARQATVAEMRAAMDKAFRP